MNIFAENTFLFGIAGFLCCIKGSKELIDLIPLTWKVFQGGSQGQILLNLEQEHFGNDACMKEGWMFHNSGQLQQAMYVQDGKVLFSLQQVADHEIKIRIAIAKERYVRLGILYGILLALKHQCVGLHGVTLLCGDEIIILSAPSGTGKTTLAHLLEKYCDAIVINGDFALLDPMSEGVIFEPTPFCGTSGRGLNYRVLVNRVVFLEQSLNNQWNQMNGREAISWFMNNTFIPTWNKEAQLITQSNIMKCISFLTVNQFSFAPTREAAELFLNQICASK